MRVLVLSCTILMLSVLHAQIKDQYLPYVNPLIGTSKMGHVFPGATVPFGMVQVSPQTNFIPLFLTDGSYNKVAYDYCAGYQYADSNILGFAHTNFSGTGHSDLGDILIMPTIGPIDFTRRNELQDHGYSSPFSHDREKASPGYYEVVLDQHQIKAEMTATERVGFHRYTFPKNEEATILL
ncbi:MAG: glycoside hydrolase family 92 protein, partial [Bacteroidota bacterium]